MKNLMILAIVVLLAGGVWYYSRQTGYQPVSPTEKEATEVSQPTPTASPSPEEKKMESTESMSPQEEIKVDLSNFRFNPPTTRIKAGQAYKLTLANKGVAHTYTVDALKLNWRLAAGETKTFDLMVDKKGTYAVYCAVPGHVELGMVGKLVVE